MNAAIYVRVSTHEQAEEGYSIEEQKERLKSFAEAKGYDVAKIYSDPGFSGSNLDRPAMQEMIKLIKTRSIDAVLVYKIDRLSRSQKDTLFLIEEIFQKNGVALISMSESFDTSTPFGIAMIGILSVFAQLEREQIRERFIMGKEARAKSGKWHGGGGGARIVTGYDYIDGSLIINEYEAQCVKYIYDRYNKGHGIFNILENVREKFPGVLSSETTISNILSNPIYIGKLKYKGEIYEGEHEPIIEEDLFNRTQELLAKRTSKTNPFRKTYLLSGIIYCGLCGARMNGRSGGLLKNGERNKYYKCSDKIIKKRKGIADEYCNKKEEAKEDIENYIISEIKKVNIGNFEQYKRKNNDKNKEVSILKKKLGGIDKQISNLVDLYSLGNIPAEVISNKIKKLNEDKEGISNRINELKKEKDVKHLEQIKETVSQLPNFDWENEETDKKRLVIATLIDRITVFENKVVIDWAF
ncbi:recombinase family protein [Siminovitchia sp. FSL H7-0308]|uniref:Site-specific DNA recombinase n=1 Tax=Siminovitchia thermophila TaxID=1245522 RepID=A0ABS2R2B2_9BACI|nr:recombinase family protein [Siminovitchia thermophila]MBM7713284.1 site-specific DNA recombinase [Siminovitchia thermophila]ONK24633.1 hypothetical protein BLX87_04515 [Bacillus sp. VT-16-64]